MGPKVASPVKASKATADRTPKDKKSTMDAFWIAGLNSGRPPLRSAFAELRGGLPDLHGIRPMTMQSRVDVYRKPSFAIHAPFIRTDFSILMRKAFVGVTDQRWFETLSSSLDLPEVNFWQPGGKALFKALSPGDLFLFKLHSPNNYIVGGVFSQPPHCCPSLWLGRYSAR